MTLELKPNPQTVRETFENFTVLLEYAMERAAPTVGGDVLVLLDLLGQGIVTLMKVVTEPDLLVNPKSGDDDVSKENE